MGTRHRQELEDKPLRFVTTTCYKWLPLLTSIECMKILASSLLFVRDKYKTDILGYVFMPNHIHLLLFLEKPDYLSSFMRDFKKFTSVAIRKQLEKEGSFDLVNELRYEAGKQKLKVWMDRFDDFSISNPRTLQTKLNYIHENPVRKQLCSAASDYLYSSAKFYSTEEEGFLKVTHYLEAIGVASQYNYGIIY